MRAFVLEFPTGTEDLVVVAEKDPLRGSHQRLLNRQFKKAVFGKRLDCVINDLRFVDPDWIVQNQQRKVNTISRQRN